MQASFHPFTAKGIIRHAEPSVKTHPEFGFLSGTAFVASGGSEDETQVRLTNLSICWMRGTLLGFPPHMATDCLNLGTPISRLAIFVTPIGR